VLQRPGTVHLSSFSSQPNSHSSEPFIGDLRIDPRQLFHIGITKPAPCQASGSAAGAPTIMPLEGLSEAAGGGRCRVQDRDHPLLPRRPQATLTIFNSILNIPSLPGESRFSFQCLTASAANASGSLQTVLTKLPRLAKLRMILAHCTGQSR
jgi:hypothetical protein